MSTMNYDVTMTGSRPCEPGCQCKKHERRGRSPEERRQHNNERHQRWRDANRERIRELNRQSYRKLRAELPPDRWRDHVRKHAHGMTRDEFMEMIRLQDGQCYLCEGPLDLEEYKSVVVDHDHGCCRPGRSCGKCRRGICHSKCNSAIGMLGDDPEVLYRVAANLAKRIKEHR